jgi:tetratricopeptide (TPR) repeat protein
MMSLNLAYKNLGQSLLTFTFLVLLLGVSLRADDFSTSVAVAQAGKFPEAKAAFEKQIQSHPSSGALLNLGVVEWQAGHAGVAILAWERAAWIDPRDARARQNLMLARAVTQVEEPELRWHEKISTWLPPNVWVWLAGASLWLAIGALVLPRIFRWRKSGGQQFAASLGLCVFIFAMTANVGVMCRTSIGFVIKKNASLKLTPTSEGEVLSALPAGEPVRRLKSRGNYYFVRTPMAAGWIDRNQVGFINE